MKTKVSLSVRDFALPVPRTGSIETHSGYGRMPVEGQEVHLRIQEKRSKQNSEYQAEVKIEAEFEREEYLFQIGGRIDGLFASDPPHIEEIKSAFSIQELTKKLIYQWDHPYSLQLQTYGYFYFLKHGIEPKLTFHLVSLRNFQSEDLKIAFNRAQYETYLNQRLEELVKETRENEARALKRKKMASKLTFSFENPRTGQTDLIESIEKGFQTHSRMLIQAPTGLGKTIGVLYPSLKESLERGQKTIYVTPKNSQHSVAEDAVERIQQAGAKIKSLTITAKSKICFKNEPLCNPDYCEYAKDHYTKLHENNVVALLSKKKKLTHRVFRALGEEFQVCPFELQFEAAQDADAVICDYNYVFSPRASLGRMGVPTLGQTGKPNLVIDEAHNLLSRAMGYYSPELSTYVLEKMRFSVRELPLRFRSDAETLLNDCLQTVSSCRPEGSTQSVLIDPPRAIFLEQEEDLRNFLSRYLESDVEIQPRDVVLRLVYYWSQFTAALDFVAEPKRPEFFTFFQPERVGNGGTIKIACCDASEMLKACYDEYDQVVGFSATLKPFHYYAKLSGLELEKIKVAEFQSPFPKTNRKVLIIPEISTKYSNREKNYKKISEVIHKISQVKPGNYFAFFPSFEFLEKVAAEFRAPEGIEVIRQQKDMKASEIEGVVDHLKSRVRPTIVFAVQGGVFSEGVDYPGETIIGAFVIGPPLPKFDLEREKMREFYDKTYQSGFEYAYSYPAMAKAVQSAGRVIRSETDRGLIVLMDSRFIEMGYASSMPTDWFETSPRELVSQAILKEVKDFWTDPLTP